MGLILRALIVASRLGEKENESICRGKKSVKMVVFTKEMMM